MRRGDNGHVDIQLAKRIATFGSGLHRLTLDDGQRAIVKRRASAPAGFFEMEAHGLELLRATGTLRVPLVLGVAGDAIVLEDLGAGRAEPAAWERAGCALARLHRHTSPAFGLDRDGWCGDSPQRNSPRLQDGHRFFAEHRLLPQARRAYDAGRLTQTDFAAVEHLARDLPARIPPQPASLVHGDLWTANLHVGADGELALIDAAAVHYGWGEADLAMLTLFGAPLRALFAGRVAAGTDSSGRMRAPLYNLYHLLNHLNLFGAAYLEGVRAVWR